MKILIIGGTGTISLEVSRKLQQAGHDVYHLNRGNKKVDFPVTTFVADINQETQAMETIGGQTFDVVADFIAFTKEQVERDVKMFRNKTSQYIFISSASAYEKPPRSPFITEETPLVNPYWQYSRDKIACEEYLWKEYRENGFPMTIVRPSHTYARYSVPVGIHGEFGSYTVLKRMQEGKPVIVHGDGSSLWTMTHTRDFATGFAGLVGNPRAIGEAVQITSGESLTWNQIYEAIADALGVKCNLCHIATDTILRFDETGELEGNLLGDKANTVIFDQSKLRYLVPGWHPEIPFAKGVKEAVDYVMSHEKC